MALLEETELDAEAIVRRAMGVAANICIYTNDSIIIERLELD
jgi:ATP-dependent HslUV protease subunit HslV